MTSLAVEFAGIRFPNPVVASAGPPTSKLAYIRQAFESGAGGVVAKTAVSGELAAMRVQPRPRFRLMDWDGLQAGSKRYVLYSIDQAYPGDLADYQEFLKAAVREAGGKPVLGSILAASPAEWAQMARQVEDAGVAGIELDPSCPHSLGEEALAAVTGATSAVCVAVRIPVVVKLPFRPDAADIASSVVAAGAKAVTIANRLPGTDFDLNTMGPVMHGSFAGQGGPHVKYAVMALIASMGRRDYGISASGGVSSWEDAAKYMLAGASTVQVCSSIIVEGFGVIPRIVSGLEKYLEAKGCHAAQDICGRGRDRMLSLDRIARGGSSHARIDAEKCRGCGRCAVQCFSEAIMRSQDGKFQVEQERCSGCGLCCEPRVCPAGALGFIYDNGTGGAASEAN